MRRIVFILVVLPLVAGIPLLCGQGGELRRSAADETKKKTADEPKKKSEPTKDGQKVSELMRRKLESSKKVLEGLTTNDFDKIRKGADDLMMISKSVEWRALKSPDYELHSNEFRRKIEHLLKSAKDKNLDGATLAYTELTLACVRCHKFVREVRMTRLD